MPQESDDVRPASRGDLWRGAQEIARQSWRAAPRATVWSLLLAPGGAVLTVLTSLWLKIITDGLVEGDQTAVLWGVAATVASIGLSRALAAAGVRVALRLSELTACALETRLAEAVAAVAGLEFFEQPQQLDRLELLQAQRGYFGYSVSALTQGLRESVRLGFSAALIAAVDPVLLGVLVIAAAPSLIVAVRARLRVDQERLDQGERYRLSQHLIDLATSPVGGREIRIFGLGEELQRRWSTARRAADTAVATQELRASSRSLVAWLPLGTGILAMLWLTVLGAVGGQISVGDAAMVLSLARGVMGNVDSVAIWSAEVAGALRFLARYVAVASAAASLRANDHHNGSLPENLTQGIELEGVGFTYSGTDQPVLTGIDLVLPAGSTVALVGDNGAGKSTLVKLLCRLYEPTAGHIMVDGQPLDTVTVAAWRRRISAGFQDFAHFELQAGESVGVGDLDLCHDTAAVNRALTQAGAATVIEGLQQGLHTQLGKLWGGTDLSTGQWQLLALGRAFMQQAPLLLVLDEPTASLDAQAEHALFSRYADRVAQRRGRGGVTVLVSHRFSTVRAADLIVVVENGGIAECGSHEKLMTAGGTYARLFRLQAESYR